MPARPLRPCTQPGLRLAAVRAPHRRPVQKCAAHRVCCPNPVCGARYSGSARGKFRGRGVATCERCGTEFFHHTADGGTEVVGLWPGEADTLDIDLPLVHIWELLGLMAVA